MALLNYGNGLQESVVTRDEFPFERVKQVLANETIAVLGYGIQGPAQALNLKDNGFNVIVGVREGGHSWQQAIADGWTPGETLFSIEEACERGTFIVNLLSDAGQIEQWEQIQPYLSKGKTLCFSHGFAVTFHEHTGIIPPATVDVILVAPKGSGRSVRRLFLANKGINCSYGVFQNASGNATEKALAYGIAVGAGYLFETTCEREVVSDLVGERGALMGALAGLIQAQYDVLRKQGHSPSEAFNETVEELTESLIPLISEKGMDWMYASCSTTAQRGALDWAPKFKKAVEPVFEALYSAVQSGEEAKHVIEKNSQPDYREQLEEELTELREREIWRVGHQVRSLRPSDSR